MSNNSAHRNHPNRNRAVRTKLKKPARHPCGMNESHDQVGNTKGHEKHRKLLDMLYGWSLALDLVGTDDREIEKVADLYQLAGNMDLGNDDHLHTDEFITEFLTNEVLPVILGRK